MGIFSRFSDIINSNIVHILDKAENPEKLVRLMIQEMEDTLIEIKSQTAKLMADKKGLERKLIHLDEEVFSWQQKAELAVSKDREDLAKAALEEKRVRTVQHQKLTAEFVVLEESLQKYRDDIEKLDQKLIDARAKQKSLIIKAQTATSQLKVNEKVTRSDKSINKFESLENRIDHLEGMVEVESIKGKSLDDEFKALENESEIDRELRELKDKMNQDKNRDNQGE